MSTRKPENIEEEGIDKQKHANTTTQNTNNSSSVNISADSSVASTASKAKETESTSKRGKRVRDIAKPKANGHHPSEEVDDILFQFEQPKDLQKKRRKTVESPAADESADNDASLHDKDVDVSGHELLPNRSHASVDVTFEDESINFSPNENVQPKQTAGRVRDHGERVRSVFRLCYDSPKPMDFGAVLVECSDDEL